MKRGGIWTLGTIAVASLLWFSLSSRQPSSPHAAPTPTPSLPFIATTTTSGVPQIYLNAKPGAALSEYIEIVDSCGPYYTGTCVNLRSGPSTSTPSVMQLRDGMVLKVASSTENEGRTWYEIGFDGEIHYPERVTGSWWVASDYTRPFYDLGEIATTSVNASSTKRIVIDLTHQTLYAYDGDTLFMQQAISTGLALTPTPAGHFFVMRKMPDSYMQGPVPGVSSQYYDLPGVPWDLYFTAQGAAIHGAYWHNHFGQVWSHGCVNLPVVDAEKLYEWADLGTPVIVEREK